MDISSRPVKRRSPWIVGAAALILLLGLVTPGDAHAQDVRVSAASSLGDVLTDVGRACEAAGGPRARLNIGGSSFLARQIVEGAPVDVFVSADEAQMDVAERAGRLVAGTRRDVLSNTLVVIATARAASTVAAPSGLALPSVRRVAMANPAMVPAGVYGRQWLTGLGLWDAVSPKVVPLLTVRSALSAVRAGRADAGIVYATDARSAPDVRVAYRVPSGEGPAITYPAAAVAGGNTDRARQFLRCLHGADARRIFEDAGFLVPAGR